MIGLSGGPELYNHPLVQDKVKERLFRKEPLKIEKDVFKTPSNPKCPSNSFIINMVFAKFKFSVKKPMEDAKLCYDRDGFSKEAVDQCEEDEEDDEEGEES